MKYLILLFLVFVSSFSSYAAILPRQLNCSREGTDVILVNGISWGRKSVEYILYKQIEPSIPKNFLDNKNPAGSFVKFKYSYNNSNGFLRDMLESAAQKLSQNFNISSSNAFIAAYYFTYKGVVTSDFIESIFNAKGVTFSSISTYLISYFSPNTLDKMVQDSFNTNATDTIKLKSSISDTLLSGKKLILITESQGNFFGKQAISDFLNGENLNFGGKTGRINNYLGTIGQVQIAPPTGSLLSKNKVVLNNRDIINLVFFERPNSNFILIPPSPDLRSQDIDRIANHYITSTYLNDENMKTGNLSALRDFTLQSIVDLASLLDSNCQKAIINYTEDELTINFDSTDLENPNLTGSTYSWDFGDGQKTTTTLKKVSHTYSTFGLYNVILKVTDSSGTSLTTLTQIKVTYSSFSFFLHVNPLGTYYFVDTIGGYDSNGAFIKDIKNSPTTLDLTEYFDDPLVNLEAGDFITIQRVGSFVPRETDPPGVEDYLTAVFRDSNGVFLFPGPEGEFNSVTTLPTYPRGISTDIPQDFFISRSDVDYLQIPIGATNIAFSAADSFFSDNSDYDKDFGVVIKITIKKAKQIPLL